MKKPVKMMAKKAGKPGDMAPSGSDLKYGKFGAGKVVDAGKKGGKKK
jgi:hypothetical protein